jgi:hypothetical protein
MVLKRLRRVDRALAASGETAMNENPPRHIADAAERRWASRMSVQARDFLKDRADRPAARTVIDKKGRSVPVTFKSRPADHCLGAYPGSRSSTTSKQDPKRHTLPQQAAAPNFSQEAPF